VRVALRVVERGGVGRRTPTSPVKGAR
jgi:hypothetical protein